MTSITDRLRYNLMVVCASVALIYAIASSGSQLYELHLAGVTLSAVLVITLLLAKFRWYEPVVAVAAMLSLLALDFIYLGVTGFAQAEHFRHRLADVSPMVAVIMLYTVAWFLCFVAGYLFLRKPAAADSVDHMRLPAIRSRWLLLAAAAIAMIIGTGNVVYNIWLFEPHNPLSFFTNFGVARHRVQENDGVFTTLGYNLFIVALVLFRISFRVWSKSRFIIWSLASGITILALLTRGQIFFTFSVIIFLMLIEFFISESKARFLKWIVFLLPFLLLVILSAYVLRLVSVEMYLADMRGEEAVFIERLAAQAANVGHLIFGKGNVPNFPAMLVFWDHFDRVEPLLYGRSLLSWLGGFIPDWPFTYTGYHISDIWYPNHVGGIPPGVVMEFYSNFGVMGGLVAAVIFGCVSAVVFNWFATAGSLVAIVIYAALISRFWFIVPKVETAALANAIWLFLPSVLAILVVTQTDRWLVNRRRVKLNDPSV